MREGRENMEINQSEVGLYPFDSGVDDDDDVEQDCFLLSMLSEEIEDDQVCVITECLQIQKALLSSLMIPDSDDDNSAGKSSLENAKLTDHENVAGKSSLETEIIPDDFAVEEENSLFMNEVCNLCTKPDSESRLIRVLGCGHYFCQNCFERLIRASGKIDSDNCSMKCPAENCSYQMESDYCLAVMLQCNLHKRMNPLRAQQKKRLMEMKAASAKQLAGGEVVIPPVVEVDKAASVSESPVDDSVHKTGRRLLKKVWSESVAAGVNLEGHGWDDLMEVVSASAARASEYVIIDEEPAKGAQPKPTTVRHGAEFLYASASADALKVIPPLRKLEDDIGRGLMQAINAVVRLLAAHKADLRDRKEANRKDEAGVDAIGELEAIKKKVDEAELLIGISDERAQKADQRADMAERKAVDAARRAEDLERKFGEREQTALAEIEKLKGDVANAEARTMATYFVNGMRAGFRCIEYEFPGTIPLDRMAAYTLVDMFDPNIRTRHPVIPYSTLELQTLKQQDVDDKLGVEWHVPALKPHNLDSVIAQRKTDMLDFDLIDPDSASRS